MGHLLSYWVRMMVLWKGMGVVVVVVVPRPSSVVRRVGRAGSSPLGANRVVCTLRITVVAAVAEVLLGRLLLRLMGMGVMLLLLLHGELTVVARGGGTIVCVVVAHSGSLVPSLLLRLLISSLSSSSSRMSFTGRSRWMHPPSSRAHVTNGEHL